MDETGILESAFHHRGGGRGHVAHTRVEYANQTDQHEVKVKSNAVLKVEQKPNLLSFFKDEGMGIICKQAQRSLEKRIGKNSEKSEKFWEKLKKNCVIFRVISPFIPHLHQPLLYATR